jgi:hypothetical protein
MKRIKLFENFTSTSGTEKYPDISDFYSEQKTLQSSEFTSDDIQKIKDFFSEMGIEKHSVDSKQVHFFISRNEYHFIPKKDCYLLEIAGKNYDGYKCSTLENVFDTIRENIPEPPYRKTDDERQEERRLRQEELERRRKFGR